jgi:hypothetical protein
MLNVHVEVWFPFLELAAMGKVAPPALVSVVEVPSTFHPVPLPVMSLGVRVTGVVADWSVPLRGTDGKPTARVESGSGFRQCTSSA